LVRTPSRTLFFADASHPVLYTLSLHDALPISDARAQVVLDEHPLGVGKAELPRQPRVLDRHQWRRAGPAVAAADLHDLGQRLRRSEEHTSELQSRFDLVCRLLLEKKNQSTTDY